MRIGIDARSILNPEKGEAIGQWLLGHWWQIGLLIIVLGIVKIRERNVWCAGYKAGRIDQARFASKEANRIKIAGRMAGGFLQS